MTAEQVEGAKTISDCESSQEARCSHAGNRAREFLFLFFLFLTASTADGMLPGNGILGNSWQNIQ